MHKKNQNGQQIEKEKWRASRARVRGHLRGPLLYEMQPHHDIPNLHTLNASILPAIPSDGLALLILWS